jgi:hypothetical protein
MRLMLLHLHAGALIGQSRLRRWRVHPSSSYCFYFFSLFFFFSRQLEHFSAGLFAAAHKNL